MAGQVDAAMVTLRGRRCHAGIRESLGKTENHDSSLSAALLFLELAVVVHFEFRYRTRLPTALDTWW